MLNVLIALGIFGTILLLMHACMAVYRMMTPRGKERAVERLQKWSVSPGASAPLDIMRKELLSEIPWLHNLLTTMRRFQPLRAIHRQADCPIPLGTFVLGVPLLALGTFLLAIMTQQPWFMALGVAAASGTLPIGYLYWLRNKRMSAFERQLPEALELVSRALRAGHAFSVGLKLVGDEAADPVGTEFRRVFEEFSMGVALTQALQNMTERLDSVDLRFFVTSVVVQRETGGNLAEIIDSLAGLMRRRFELQLKVNALSAEGRFSGLILFCLPIAVGLVLYQLNPQYMGVLVTDPMGRMLLMIGSFLMVSGGFIMKRIIAIKV